MKVKYITEPKEQYITRTKTKDMIYARTTIHCPLCKAPIPSRQFEKHVRTEHTLRADECFAMLYGLPWPYRCGCGKELCYSSAHKGFPKSCGTCNMGTTSKLNYKNAEEAHKHVEQLEAMLAEAKSEEKRLSKEAELSRVPLAELPFPTKKDFRFLKRLSMGIRVNAVNCDKEKLFELANVIDNMIKELV